MVDSNIGITNIPVIIDASIPNVGRNDSQMWNKDDKLEQVKCVIPERCYFIMYAIIKGCQATKQFDWTSTGHVSNVSLVAQKVDE